MAKPKKEPKPPVLIRFQVAADGKHPYYFAARQGGNDPNYPERTELECVVHYVTRILHPKEDCYVFIQEKDTPNWNTDVWNTYLVKVTGDTYCPIYDFYKIENENAHGTNT